VARKTQRRSESGPETKCVSTSTSKKCYIKNADFNQNKKMYGPVVPNVKVVNV
jgi:hypothetical protein